MTESAEALGALAVDVTLQEKPSSNRSNASGQTSNTEADNQIIDENEDGQTRRISLDTRVAHSEQKNQYADHPKALEAGVAMDGSDERNDKEGIIMVDWNGPDDPENPRK